MPSYFFYFEHFPPNRRQRGFNFSLRPFISTRRERVSIRSGQPLPVQLSVGRKRQGFQPHISRRNHILRQPLCQIAAQFFCSEPGPHVAWLKITRMFCATYVQILFLFLKASVPLCLRAPCMLAAPLRCVISHQTLPSRYVPLRAPPRPPRA